MSTRHACGGCETLIPTRYQFCGPCSRSRCVICKQPRPGKERRDRCPACKREQKRLELASPNRACAACKAPLFERRDHLCGLCRGAYRKARLARLVAEGRTRCCQCLVVIEPGDGYRTCQRCRRRRSQPARAALAYLCEVCRRPGEEPLCATCRGLLAVWAPREVRRRRGG